MPFKSKIFDPQSKVIFHTNKVLNYFNNKNSDPITLEIDPSNACNHSCPFCISGHIHLQKFKGTKFFDRRILDRKILLNLIKDLSKTKINSVTFTGGGEPTMNPALKEAIEYLRNNSKIKIGMFSNGTMLEKFDLFETIAESLSWIRISMDAGVKTKYDKLRVTNKNNNFDVVIKNIKKLISVKKKRNLN